MKRVNLILVAMIGWLGVPPLIAQTITKDSTQRATPLTASSSSSVNRVVTPAEQEQGLFMHKVINYKDYDGTVRDFSAQIDSLLAHRARNWVISLQTRPVRGIQLDPMGQLYVAAGQDELARQQFAKRLATPGLSVNDRAYTLLLGVTTFTGVEYGFSQDKTITPARIQTALSYLAQLDSLPASFALVKFKGHAAMGRAYYEAGNGVAAIGQLKSALALVPSIPFERREYLGVTTSLHSIGDSFVLLADILSGQPNGRAQIDSIGALLLSYASATPEQMAGKPLLQYQSQQNVRWFTQNTLQVTGHLGRQAPAITAHLWWNTTTPSTSSPDHPGATIKALNDGKIRLMQFGHFGCGGCIAALPGMERLRKAAPSNVEVWYVTYTSSSWGAEPATPNEVAQHLKHYYLERKKYGMPIAMWVGPLVSDPDAGVQPQESPTFEAYPIRGTPWFFITDGRGIVRHLSFGFSETLLERTMRYLAAEAAREARADIPGPKQALLLSDAQITIQ